MFVLQVIDAATNRLDFTNDSLPARAGRLGCVVMRGAVFVYWRACAGQGPNWSPTPEIRMKHAWITLASMV